MLKENLRIVRKKVTVIEVDLSGAGVEGYALAWLKLTNNARENKDVFWKVENNRTDDIVSVYVNPKYADRVKDFCNEMIYYNGVCIGKIIDEYEDEVGVPVYEYDSTCGLFTHERRLDFDKAIVDWIEVREMELEDEDEY